MQQTIKRALGILCICVTASQAFSQYYFRDDKHYSNDIVFEVGGSLGLMNSFTDLGGRSGQGKGFLKDYTFKTSRPSVSIYGAAIYREWIAVRLEASFGTVQGYDSILRNVAASTQGRYERNLSFKSHILDVQLAAELHPLFFKYYEENQAPFLSPYIVGGIGVFNFNPRAKLNDRWYDLQPLRTEGQGLPEYPDRRPYRLTQFNIPLGIGLRYEVNTNLFVRAEFVHRILFTDYLDDVSTTYVDPSVFYSHNAPAQAGVAAQLANRAIPMSNGYVPAAGEQRGDPSDNDAFFTFQLKLGYTFPGEKRKGIRPTRF